MNINATKTKGMFVSFQKVPPEVPHVTIKNEEVERVSDCKLLGVYLNDRLSWDTHIDKMYKRACQRVHFVGSLKRTNMIQKDLVKVYTSLVRPVLEYACQVWHPGLTKGQADMIESVQERILKLIYPNQNYFEALSQARLESLFERREMLCERLFVAAQDPQHKLSHLMPPLRETSTRDNYPYVIPLAHTNRYKNTFINYGLNKRW